MTLVVVGASLAGLRAVESARRTGYRGRIVLVGAEEHPPYDRPPLSKAFLAAGVPRAVELFHAEAVLRDELGVELMLGAPAEGLDTAAREVIVAGTPVPYDALVIATGATARGLPGARTLRTAEDAVAVRAALDEGARTVVVGAAVTNPAESRRTRAAADPPEVSVSAVAAGRIGNDRHSIGSEVASAARKRGLPVMIVEAAATPLVRAVGESAGAGLAELHREAGTELRLATEVTAVTGDGVRLATGEVLRADLVVAGIGAVPATGWLEGSGLTLHERDRGVVCDATLSAGSPGVYAAGDVAHVANPLFDGEPMRLEHWTNAAEQGAAAVRHALDPASARPLGAVPYFWSDWYGHRIQFVGTPRADEVVSAGGVTLYRRGDRIAGALTVDRPREIILCRSLPIRPQPRPNGFGATVTLPRRGRPTFGRTSNGPPPGRRPGRLGRGAGFRGRGLEWRS